VHQVRVACRRLTAWLDLGRRRVGRDDLKWLRDAAGPVRDLDVLLARDLSPAMHRWLLQQWRKERTTLETALDDPRALATVRLFENMGPLRSDEIDMTALLDKADKALGAVDEKAAHPDELHVLRRKLRPVRYALEWQKKDSQKIVEAQDSLGALSDAVILHRMAVAWGKDAALERELARQLRALARAAIPTLPAIRATLKALR